MSKVNVHTHTNTMAIQKTSVAMITFCKRPLTKTIDLVNLVFEDQTCCRHVRFVKFVIFNTVVRAFMKSPSCLQIQVNLFQKRSFVHQLTHNMTTDCSLIYDFSTRKVQNILCTKIVFCFCFGIQNNFCTQHVLNLYFSCTELVIQ